MSLNLRINVLEKFKKCPGMSLNVLEFDFENPVATMILFNPILVGVLRGSLKVEGGKVILPQRFTQHPLLY